MKQTLHIFAKDSRRFWPEILISVVVTAAFVLVYPRQWMPAEYSVYARDLQYVANALTVLVPISWWLLIARVVHAESLVGDNQFWLTRPYEWKKLLAAKALFLLAWLYIPFFLAQSILLMEAGFHPLSYAPGLLFNLVLTTGILILPLFAVATVTANFARMALTLLGVLLLVIGFAFVATLHDRSSASVPGSDRVSIPLVFCIGGVAILLQYATRRVWRSRLLLIALPVLVGAVAYAISSSDELQVDKAYPIPASGASAPVQFSLVFDLHHTVVAGASEQKDQVSIEIPLKTSGIAEGYAVQADNVKFTMVTGDGFRWSSPWHAVYGMRYRPDSGISSVQIEISRALFDRFRSAPVTLTLTFAVDRLQTGNITHAAYPADDSPIPGIGFCSPRSPINTYFNTQTLYCRSALHQPQLTYVATVSSSTRCTDPPMPTTTVQSYDWVGDLAPDPADFGITSVWTPEIFFFNNSPNEPDSGGRVARGLHWHVCAGSPLVLTEYHLVDRSQTSVTIPNFSLPTNVSRGTGDILEGIQP